MSDRYRIGRHEDKRITVLDWGDNEWTIAIFVGPDRERLAREYCEWMNSKDEGEQAPAGYALGRNPKP